MMEKPEVAARHRRAGEWIWRAADKCIYELTVVAGGKWTEKPGTPHKHVERATRVGATR